MKYLNNHLVIGTTAVLYNVDISIFFDSQGRLKENFENNLYDVGVRYKKIDEQVYKDFSILEESPVRTTDSFKGDTDENTYETDTYLIQRYKPYDYQQSTFIYPCRVLIKELESDTLYVIESYYVDDNGVHFYNEQSFQTLADTSNITFDEIRVESSVPEEIKQECVTLVSTVLKELNDIFKMFCPVTAHFSPSIYYAKNGIAADSGMSFNAYYFEGDNTRSVAVHEMAHNFLDENFANEEEITKFMEFATGVEEATWKWCGKHNYPIISSARYSYIDDCLVAAAC